MRPKRIPGERFWLPLLVVESTTVGYADPKPGVWPKPAGYGNCCVIGMSTVLGILGETYACGNMSAEHIEELTKRQPELRDGVEVVLQLNGETVLVVDERVPSDWRRRVCYHCGYYHDEAPVEELRCPEDMESATGFYDPAGIDVRGDNGTPLCAGCGCDFVVHRHNRPRLALLP